MNWTTLVYFCAICAICLRSVSSKAIKETEFSKGGKIVEPPFEKEEKEKNEEESSPVENKETEPKNEEKENNPDDEMEKITPEMLKKHCKDPQAAMDYIFCDNFLPANIRNRDRVKGKDHIKLENVDLIFKDDDSQQHHRRRRVAIDKRWPTKEDGTVEIPYQYGTSYSDVRNMFGQAIQDYNRYTCIRFVPRRSTDVNYIDVISDSGCYTYAGMIGGRQVLSLQANSYCTSVKGVAIHEAMHVLGFLHTQSRRDRDRYITVHYNNIPSSLHRQFNEHSYGEAHVYGVSYDKRSVMHYGRRSGAYSGTYSITSNSDPNEELGQRDGFSEKDILQINRMYCPHLVNTV